jgi:hypothetical protein
LVLASVAQQKTTGLSSVENQRHSVLVNSFSVVENAVHEDSSTGPIGIRV